MSFGDFCEASIKVLTVLASVVAVGAGVCSAFDKSKKRSKAKKEIEEKSNDPNPATKRENESVEEETASDNIISGLQRADRNCRQISAIVGGLSTLAYEVSNIGNTDNPNYYGSNYYGGYNNYGGYGYNNGGLIQRSPVVYEAGGPRPMTRPDSYRY